MSDPSKLQTRSGDTGAGAGATPPYVLLFDGDCVFCNGTVRFIARRDPKRRFRFASLQSSAGRRLLAQCGVPEETDSVVLIEDGRGYIRSEAALRAALRLRGAWPLLYVFQAVPLRWRDAAYDAFAARRYRWFGRQTEACALPSPEVRSRLLPEEDE
ncbi:DCC1-like thiol-disulfide oxidoreductase family protein [Cohnella lubricantis]|uniref:DUF393 domain-containing protein n=1 Tax=Cohnella lubricantis TaxID=2163172 RepID=A0A841TAK0_9BACL|nr:DCC1-like thiol-disulfide oxidoreductase family protein [Cohnella lubricantis]MBB6677059.1 DUF393 domain-containing protein [Cohnella lubricantis]MBP2118906.1 putative DCC family thiol-disulfide oxidoreductase YuxK [Cohnella lubricantis]